MSGCDQQASPGLAVARTELGPPDAVDRQRGVPIHVRVAVDVGICGAYAEAGAREARGHAWGHAHCSSESWKGTKAGRASAGVGKSVCSESVSEVYSSEKIDEGRRLRLGAVMALVTRVATTGMDWSS